MCCFWISFFFRSKFCWAVTRGGSAGPSISKDPKLNRWCGLRRWVSSCLDRPRWLRSPWSCLNRKSNCNTCLVICEFRMKCNRWSESFWFFKNFLVTAPLTAHSSLLLFFLTERNWKKRGSAVNSATEMKASAYPWRGKCRGFRNRARKLSGNLEDRMCRSDPVRRDVAPTWSTWQGR